MEIFKMFIKNMKITIDILHIDIAIMVMFMNLCFKIM